MYKAILFQQGWTHKDYLYGQESLDDFTCMTAPLCGFITGFGWLSSPHFLYSMQQKAGQEPGSEADLYIDSVKH